MELLSIFFKPKWNVRISILSSILLIFTYFVFFDKADLVLFPSEKPLQVDLYTDQNDNGNSLLLDSIRNDSCIGMRFLLKEGFVNPYAGFNLAKYKDSLVDVADYNRLELELHAVNVSDLHIYLITKDKHVKDMTNRLAYRHNYFNVDMVSGKNVLDLKISEFATPDWWYTVVGQPKSDFEKIEWNKLNRVAFATGINPKLDTTCSIMLYRLRFYRNNFVVIGYLLAIQFGIMGLLFLLHYRKSNKLATKERQAIQIHYKAVGVEEKPKSGYAFLDYIHQHFTDSELNLAQIAKETGVPQRNISDTISEKFDCNFKTYVNQIRINEAKRLLKETDLNSSEIAYAVGFSSPGSFNRVFKNLTGKTPSECSRH